MKLRKITHNFIIDFHTYYTQIDVKATHEERNILFRIITGNCAILYVILLRIKRFYICLENSKVKTQKLM